MANRASTTTIRNRATEPSSPESAGTRRGSWLAAVGVEDFGGVGGDGSAARQRQWAEVGQRYLAADTVT